MAKTKIPVVKTDTLILLLNNDYQFKSIHPFTAPGSVPANRRFGCVDNYPEWYDWVDAVEFTGTLEYHSFINDIYQAVGHNWRNPETGAIYFQKIEDFEQMLQQTSIVQGRVRGHFAIHKKRYTYSIKWSEPNTQ